jgi:group II intron reverse transcriptase/maturase
MLKAFKRVKRNRGKAGVDKVSIQMFEANLEQNLLALMYDLKHRGHYHAAPLRRAYIPKGGGKLRPLGIPTVRDRVAQEVIRSLLEPIFEPTFSPFSFGFRPGLDAHQAIEVLNAIHREGFTWVVDADIVSFFDNIPHELIIDLVAERVADGNILGIVREFLAAGVLEDLKFLPTTSGTPQGGVISPLLANITLNVLDQRLTQHGYRFVRYADDFVVLCRDEASAKQALDFVSNVLLDELGLRLSPEKTKVTTFVKGVDFLGFHLTRRRASVRPKSIAKFKDRVRQITSRSHNLDHEVVRKLNRVLIGFANYFTIPGATLKEQFRELDYWIRHRLRAMKLKAFSLSNNRRWPARCLARLGVVSLLGQLG